MSQADAGTLGSECHIYGAELKKIFHLSLFPHINSFKSNRRSPNYMSCVFSLRNKEQKLLFTFLAIGY